MELPVAPIGRIVRNRKVHNEMPITAMDRIFKNAGAERVSKDAKEALGIILSEMTYDIVTELISVSKHSGRKTIKADDINRVVNNYNYETHIHHGESIIIGSNSFNLDMSENISIENSFNTLYQQISDSDIKKHVKLIQDELKKDEVNSSKIRNSVDWLKKHGPNTIIPIIQIILSLYNLTPPH